MATYNITISQLSGQSLAPGDIVNITAGAAYNGNITINKVGTAGAGRITINGNGQVVNGTISVSDNAAYLDINELYSEDATGNGFVFRDCEEIVGTLLRSIDAGSNGYRVMNNAVNVTLNDCYQSGASVDGFSSHKSDPNDPLSEAPTGIVWNNCVSENTLGEQDFDITYADGITLNSCQSNAGADGPLNIGQSAQNITIRTFTASSNGGPAKIKYATNVTIIGGTWGSTNLNLETQGGGSPYAGLGPVNVTLVGNIFPNPNNSAGVSITRVNQSTGNVFFREDFSGWNVGVVTEADIVGQWGAAVEVKFLNENVDIVADAGSSSGKAMRFKFKDNTFGFTNGSRIMWRLADAGFATQDEVYLKYRIKHVSPYNAVLGGKQPLAIWGSKIPDAQTTPVDGDGWSDIVMWKEAGNTKGDGDTVNSPASNSFELKHFTYHQAPIYNYGDFADSRYFKNQTNNDRILYTGGVTREFVTRVKMNTLGQANGLIETWVDGVKVFSWSNYKFRNNLATEGVYGFEFQYFFGGNNSTFQADGDTYVIVSDVVLQATNPLLEVGTPTDVATPTSVQATKVNESTITISGNYSQPTGRELIVIERSLNGTSGWASIGQFLATFGWSFQNTGLNPNTRYYYRVKAIDSQGALADSGYSATVNAITDPITVPSGDFKLQYSVDGGSTWTDQTVGANSITVSYANYGTHGLKVRAVHIENGCTSTPETIIPAPAPGTSGTGGVPLPLSVITADIEDPDAITVSFAGSKNRAGSVTGNASGTHKITLTLLNESDLPSVQLTLAPGATISGGNLTSLTGLGLTVNAAFTGGILSIVKNTSADINLAFPIRVQHQYDDGNGYGLETESSIPYYAILTADDESADTTQAGAGGKVVPAWAVGGIDYVSGPLAALWDSPRYRLNFATSGTWRITEYFWPGMAEPAVNQTEEITVTTTLRAALKDWVENSIETYYPSFGLNYDAPSIGYTSGVDRNSSFYNSSYVPFFAETVGPFYAIVQQVATGEYFKITFNHGAKSLNIR